MSDRTRKMAAVGILAVAGIMSLGDGATPPAPTPTELDLSGSFSGGTGPSDAAIVAALSRELADEIEADGKAREPYMKAAIHFDTLRTRARELRCRGRLLGEAHPEARDRIAAYLDKAVGNAGGPVDAAGRAAWVRAFRVIGDAADAAR
jgi:hypothetical protein